MLLFCFNAEFCANTSPAPSALLHQEWAEAKSRQDQQLESIETGLGQLKEIGAAMNEELQRHDVLINEVGAIYWGAAADRQLRPLALQLTECLACRQH